MVLDKILVKSKDKTYEIDSYNNKTIEEIRINDDVYHFAELNYSQGISKLQMEDAVEEPFYWLQIEGNTSQKTYNGHNLFDLSRDRHSGYATLVEKTENSITVKSNSAYYHFSIPIPNWQNLLGKTVTISCKFKKTGGYLRAGIRIIGFNGNLANAGGTQVDAVQPEPITVREGTLKATKTITKIPDIATYPNAQYCLAIYANCQGAVSAEEAKNETITYWDIQIEIGDEVTEYEPYVGGTPSPNTSYPQPIKTVKDMEITVRGTNLFDIDKVKGCDQWATAKPDDVGQYGYGTKLADGSLQSKVGVYDSGSIWTGAKIPIEKSGNYYCSYEVKIDSSINTLSRKVTFGLRNTTKSTGKRSTVYTVSKIGEWEKVSLGYITVPNDWVGDDVYLSTQLNGDSTQFTNLPVYFRNIMITYGEHTAYEPYKEPVTYTIPDDLYGERFYLGKLDIASTGIPAEYLPYTTEMDNVQVYNDADPYGGIGHVLLTKVTGKYEFTGRETIIYDGTYEYGHAMCVLELAGIGSIPGMLGQCAKCTIASHGANVSDVGGGVFDIWGNGSNTSSIMFMMPSLSSTDEFMAILRERYDAGNPEYVIYPRESVYGTLIEYSEAGQELLKVSNVKGTSVLEMKSELEPMVISVDYWKQKRPIR